MEKNLGLNPESLSLDEQYDMNRVGYIGLNGLIKPLYQTLEKNYVDSVIFGNIEAPMGFIKEHIEFVLNNGGIFTQQGGSSTEGLSYWASKKNLMDDLKKYNIIYGPERDIEERYKLTLMRGLGNVREGEKAEEHTVIILNSGFIDRIKLTTTPLGGLGFKLVFPQHPPEVEPTKHRDSVTLGAKDPEKVLEMIQEGFSRFTTTVFDRHHESPPPFPSKCLFQQTLIEIIAKHQNQSSQ